MLFHSEGWLLWPMSKRSSHNAAIEGQDCYRSDQWPEDDLANCSRTGDSPHPVHPMETRASRWQQRPVHQASQSNVKQNSQVKKDELLHKICSQQMKQEWFKTSAAVMSMNCASGSVTTILTTASAVNVHLWALCAELSCQHIHVCESTLHLEARIVAFHLEDLIHDSQDVVAHLAKERISISSDRERNLILRSDLQILAPRFTAVDPKGLHCQVDLKAIEAVYQVWGYRFQLDSNAAMIFRSAYDHEPPLQACPLTGICPTVTTQTSALSPLRWYSSTRRDQGISNPIA
jgi:hypothetical protein